MTVGEEELRPAVAVIRNDDPVPRLVTVRPTGSDPSACKVALTLGPVQLPHDFVAGPRSVLVPVGGQAYIGVGVVPAYAGKVACWYEAA